jgi:hypothetical protein
MSNLYCPVCQKITPHKLVMRRCQTEHCTKWQEFQSLLVMLMRGEHYYKMERHCICRVCNHLNAKAEISLPEPHVSS